MTQPSPSPTDDRARLPSPFNTSPERFELIAQGAEALVYRTTYLSPARPAALKVRVKKSWRHEVLDRRLTRGRLLAEARVLVRLGGVGVGVELGPGGKGGKGLKGKGKGVKEGGGEGEGNRNREGMRRCVPAVLGLDWDRGWLVTEWIEGKTVKRAMYDAAAAAAARNEGQGQEEGKAVEGRLRDLLRRIGEVVGRLHAAGVIHGDLTTSNLMLRPPPSNSSTSTSTSTFPSTSSSNSADDPSLAGDIVVIDFGLATQSTSDEDRAVDLYVLERAFGSTHPAEEGLFPEVLRAYAEGKGSGMSGDAGKGKAKGVSSGEVVVRKLEDVRMRGRKKSMIG